jgi:hypothetical protein
MSAIRNTSDAFHQWANNARTRGGSGNVTFGGGTLFSYLLIIGRHVNDPDTGCTGILITGDSYSVTTAKHISKARHACRVSFNLPAGMALTERTTPAEVRAGWEGAIARKAADYAEARSKPSKAKAFRELAHLVDQADRLAEHFALPRFEHPPEDASVAAYIEGHAARELARRATESAERAAARAAREARDAERREEQRANVPRWLAGEDVNLGYDMRGEFGDLLRLVPAAHLLGDAETIETSQRAYVPAADARRAAPLLLRIVARAVETGEPWTPGAFAPKLGHYTVNGVGRDGTLTVGCHTFRRAEVERFCAVLGVVVVDDIPAGAK